MTDLLASLVDRALDRAPVLERRRPALFERGEGAVFSEGLQVEKAASLEEDEIVVESQPPAPGPKHFIDNASPRLSSHDDEPEVQPLDTRPPQRRRSHVADAIADEKENAPASVASVKERSEPAKPEARSDREVGPVIKKVEPITVSPQRLIETIVERRIEREIVEQKAKDKPAIEEADTLVQSPKLGKNPPETGGAQLKPHVKTAARSLRPPQEQTNITPIKQQKPAPRVDPVPRARTTSRAEPKQNSIQPPPVIHVTIGRVEVRATKPSARPRATQPAGPKLSLEDYLRSRGGKS